jgi:hypothetical protein
MRVTWCDFRPGIADANDRSAVKNVIRQTLVFHPAAMQEPIAIQFPEGLGTAELDINFLFGQGWLVPDPVTGSGGGEAGNEPTPDHPGPGYVD